MIFKTSTDINGKVGNHLNDGLKNIFNGGFFTPQTFSLSEVLPSSDIDTIKAYNTEFDRLKGIISKYGASVSDATIAQKACQNTMGEASDKVKTLQKNANGGKIAIDGLTKSSKAAELGMKALSVAGNILVSVLITEAISALYKFSQVSKDVANSAQEIGSSFKETKKDINSYKEKVEELRGVINNSSSSVSEVTQARKDLMAVQDELIEKFGTEKESISAITEAINGQAGAWEKLTSQKWQEAKNEFNGKGGIIKDVSNLTKGYDDNIERMQDEYGKYEETIDFGSISGDKNRQKAEELLKNFGEFSKTSAGIGQIKISGNATEVYEKILAIQETLDKMDVDFGKSFDTDLTNKANKVKDVSDKYKDFYNQFVLNEKILNDNEKGYSDYFNQITKDYDDYKKAVDSNDTTKISEKENAFAKQVVDSMNAAIENGDTDVADYFRNMYPELESIINDWDFKIKFSADTDNLKTDTQKAVDKLGGLSKEQLLDFNPKTATEKQKEGYSDLITLSEKYHMSISEFIDILEKLGLVSSTFNKELISKYSPDETSDKDDQNKAQYNVDNPVNQNDINNWLNGLPDADKKIVQSTSFENALKQRQKELDGASLSLNEYKNALEKVKQTEEATASDTSKTSFKKAWAGLDNNEDYKNTKKEVLELAEAGKLTDETFAKADGGNAKKYFDSMNIGAEEAVKKINATVDAVKQLSSLKTGITSLRDAYTEKKESKNNVVGSDTLGKLEDEFGNLGKAWTNYKKIAGSSKRNLKDLSSAQNQLAQAYLNSNNFLSNLVDKTGKYDESVRQLYISQLKDMGVKNAEEVVDSEISRQLDDAAAGYAALSEQQRETITSTSELKDKTADALIQLYLEATGSEEAKNALLRLSLINTNWEDLDATETYNQLIKIAEAAGIATGTIKGLQDLKLVAPDISSGNSLEYLNNTVGNSLTTGGIVTNPFAPNNKKTTTKTKKQATNEAYNDLLKKLGGGNSTVKVKIEMPNVSTAPTGGGGKGGGGKNSSSDSKTQFDWIERRITNLQTRFDRWKTIIENSSLKFIDKYYKKATSYAKKLVNTEGSAYTKYLKKANGVKLNKSLKAKVRNGKISGKTSDLIKEYGSKTADKIQKYQDYYEKATSALDSFVEKAQELYNLPLDKAAGKIEKFSDAIDLLEKKLDNAITATAKNKIIDDEVKQKKKTYDANKSANNKAQKNLKSAGKTLKKSVGKRQKKSTTKAVKNGKEVDLAKFKEGSKAYKAAVKYNAALNAKTKAQQEKDVSEQEYNYYKDIEAPKTKFDNVKDEYENKLTVIDTRIQNLDNQIDNIEASGATVDNSFYREKKKQTDQKKALLIEEKNRLTESLKGIKKYSAEWYTANDEINKVNDSIAECTKTQYELNDAIAEGNKKIFEKKLEGYQRIIDEQDFLLGLIEHEDSVDSDTGVRTDAGNARLHSYTADYYASDEKVNIATAERQRLENMKATKEYGVGYEYSSLEALNNAINDIIKIQQENIASKYSIEKKIVDEVTKSYQAQMAVLQKLIDKKKEQLETEKDIYDYQKQIKEKTKNIDTLRKQLAAMNGDTSKEAMAQKQKLQVSLNDAVDDLKDSEYDRYISDVSKMLDKLQKEYQEWQKKFLKKFDELLAEGLGIGDSTNGSYLATIAKNSGYNIQNPNANNNGKGGVNNDGSANGNTNPVKLEDNNSSNNNSSNNNSSKSSSSAPKVNNKITAIGIESEETKAKQYINKNKSKSTKPLREYSYVNQKIAALTKDKHGTYVLSTSHLKGLAKLLGVKQDGNYKKSGKLAKKLHSIGLKGFSKGGVVSVDSLNKQIRANGDDGLASVKNGEAILTPAQTEMFKQFVENMQGNLPQQNHKMSNNLANLAKVIPNNIDYGGVNFNFELNNVTNGDEFIREIQTNQKMQKALRSVTVDEINGGGRLSVNRIK